MTARLFNKQCMSNTNCISTSTPVYPVYRLILVQTLHKVIKGYQAITEAEIYSRLTTDSSRTVATAGNESHVKVD